MTLTRVLALLLLTTTASLIAAPYFGGNVDFPTLWLRLFILALVMMCIFGDRCDLMPVYFSPTKSTRAL
ncbi:MAG: hypothetical protein H7232_14410 [Aeromicrobium sp.]|nr:hypothetical protein [Burkholderiales bacterium]